MKTLILTTAFFLFVSSSFARDISPSFDRDSSYQSTHHHKAPVVKHRPFHHHNTPVIKHRPSHHRIAPVIKHRNHRPTYHSEYRTKHHYYRPGYRIHKFHKHPFYFHIGSIGYYYLDGFFYRPYNDYYVVVTAPIGAVVPILPSGYVKISIGGTVYYKFHNTFFRPYGVNYIVVKPPMVLFNDDTSVDYNNEIIDKNSSSPYPVGTIFINLPIGSTLEIIDGKKYWVFDNVYLKPIWRNNRLVYMVVDLGF